MKKMFLILSLLMSVSLFAQGTETDKKVDPKDFYYKVLEVNVDAVEQALVTSGAADISKLDAKQAQAAIESIATNWCKNEAVDRTLIVELTLMFSKLSAATDADKVKTIKNSILPLFENYSRDPNSQDAIAKLSAMVEVLLPQIDVFKLADQVDEMLSGLISTGQLKTAIISLVDKAGKENKVALAQDLLTKATSLNDDFMSGKDKEEITAKIKAVASSILEKNKELLQSRIKSYSIASIEASYEYALNYMVYKIFSLKGAEDSYTDKDTKKGLYSEIILGTPERDFQDGLLTRINDLPNISPVTADAITLLFLAANDRIMYQGAEYTPATLLNALFSYNSLYNAKTLQDIYEMNKVPADYSFNVMNKDFSLKEILPCADAFEKIKALGVERSVIIE